MKRAIHWALGAAMVLATSAAAAAEFSGNVTYASDYRFRGISQGDRSQAIQGGFDITAENGLYFGTWASNVTFSGGLRVESFRRCTR